MVRKSNTKAHSDEKTARRKLSCALDRFNGEAFDAQSCDAANRVGTAESFSLSPMTGFNSPSQSVSSSSSTLSFQVLMCVIFFFMFQSMRRRSHYACVSLRMRVVKLADE